MKDQTGLSGIRIPLTERRLRALESGVALDPIELIGEAARLMWMWGTLYKKQRCVEWKPGWTWLQPEEQLFIFDEAEEVKALLEYAVVLMRKDTNGCGD